MIFLQNCKIEACQKPAKSCGMCSAHYAKNRKYGDPLAGRTNRGGDCTIHECTRPVKAHGMCALHYERYRRRGDASISSRPAVRCQIDGCSGKHKGHGLCFFHYDRKRRFGDPLGGGERRLSPNSQALCSVGGCGKKAVSKNLCTAHFSKLKKYGSPTSGGVQDGRSKEWRVNKIGYVYKFDPKSPYAGKNNLVYQHRQVVGEAIGRPLDRTENVHHKNGDRADNRIENLELWIKSQPAGQRVSDQVKWAREILEKYGGIGILDVL